MNVPYPYDRHTQIGEHYLQRSGYQCPDSRLTRLISVAAQKFIGEIASDALQYCKLRQQALAREKRDRGPTSKDKRLVLTIDDLSAALREYGVTLRKQEYFADSPAVGGVPTTKDKAPAK
ncbi:hypothetical protein CBR_g30254 [Chara braunii]|uniref:Transcription initiation factor TFIID subunit 10 n=1 Tax=Chara braunii TaxID=69332 RepID=A0A388LCR7_CHABU|nr:hypothetical protein CBR_g30254 [Chara braunii]|eukprot:GBG79993.1 hypothetical protein CBR_g30254 [Chara braunii]